MRKGVQFRCQLLMHMACLVLVVESMPNVAWAHFYSQIVDRLELEDEKLEGLIYPSAQLEGTQIHSRIFLAVRAPMELDVSVISPDGTYYIILKYDCRGGFDPNDLGLSGSTISATTLIDAASFKGLNVTTSYQVEPVFTTPGLYCFVFSPHWKDRGEESGDVHVSSVVWPRGVPVPMYSAGSSCRQFVE